MGLGTAEVPSRPHIFANKFETWLGVMPAYLANSEAMGVKIVGDNPHNFKKGKPNNPALMLLNNPQTGEPLMVMDGTCITKFRTGAAGAVAARYLARKDSRTVGIIGCGSQGEAQLSCLKELFKIEEVKAYDAIPQRRKSYVQNMEKELELDITEAEFPRQTVEGSDIVVTCSTSTTPVINGEWLSKGVHVNAIGAFTPQARELDSVTIARADKIVLDVPEARETGDISIPVKEGAFDLTKIHGEIGELVTGRKAGRTSIDEITVFKTVGSAAIDVSTAFRVYQIAKSRGMGTEIDI